MFLFDEILTENGDVDPLRLECLKYLKAVCVSGSAMINGICITETVCPVPIAFDYKTDDEDINKILRAAHETFLLNSFYQFTDCPT